MSEKNTLKGTRVCFLCVRLIKVPIQKKSENLLNAPRTTINSDPYIDTLRKLKAIMRRVRPYLDMSKVGLQQDNARPHTSLKTR